MYSHTGYSLIGQLPHPNAAHLVNPTLFEIEDEYGTYTIFFGHKRDDIEKVIDKIQRW